LKAQLAEKWPVPASLRSQTYMCWLGMLSVYLSALGCLGPAVAMGLVTADSFQIGTVTVNNAQWIYWVGPLISSCILAFFYRWIPPGYTVFIKEQQKAL